MIINRKVSSIESSFRMENMQFDQACRKRVTDVLEKKISVTEAVSELNKKYNVSQKQNERSSIWPSEKLYRYLVRKYLSDKKLSEYSTRL